MSASTVSVCPRCSGRGAKRLRGAERIREAMGWPREEPDTECRECIGRGLVLMPMVPLEAPATEHSCCTTAFPAECPFHPTPQQES